MMFLKIIPFVEYLLYNYWKNTIINIFCIFYIYFFFWGFFFLILTYGVFIFSSLFISPPFPFRPPSSTLIYTHTHLLTLIHTYTHLLTHTHTHTHSHSHSYTHTLTHTHTHTYLLTLTHIYSHSLTHIHSLTHTYIALPKGRIYVLASLGGLAAFPW